MTGALEPGVLNVRMYHPGFGDCFLLSFPVEQTHEHILIDCGAHTQGTLGNLPDIADDVARTTGNRLVAVVATHRHQDHIWGFERGLSKFKEMDIGEVWLPWLEDMSNDAARELWKKHAKALRALELRLTAAPRESRAILGAVLANLKPNEVALKALNGHFGARHKVVQYLGTGSTDLRPERVPGLTVKVLGPPRDAAFLKRMNPPKSESWERFAEDGSPTVAEPIFEERFRWKPPKSFFAADAVFDAVARKAFDDAAIEELDAAFKMEDAVNNSSLVLLFSFKGTGLLMVGDAQWGNWQSWIDQPRTGALLDQVTLYKCGHHGSFNATPHSVVERLPEGVSVMMPTWGQKPFPTIPDAKLVAALQKRSGNRVVRNDAHGPVPNGFRRGATDDQKVSWVDYSLKVG
jgi:beta-lactamase superfamily II metal-dependent hydrolase